MVVVDVVVPVSDGDVEVPVSVCVGVVFVDVVVPVSDGDVEVPVSAGVVDVPVSVGAVAVSVGAVVAQQDVNFAVEAEDFWARGGQEARGRIFPAGLSGG